MFSSLIIRVHRPSRSFKLLPDYLLYFQYRYKKEVSNVIVLSEAKEEI
jgi:hypothetical protein